MHHLYHVVLFKIKSTVLYHLKITFSDICVLLLVETYSQALKGDSVLLLFLIYSLLFLEKRRY